MKPSETAVHQNGCAIAFKGGVVIGAVGIELEFVLKARAATAVDGDSQGRLSAAQSQECVLRRRELL